MEYSNNIVKDRIKDNIIYNSIILLIFLFWLLYSTIDNILLLLLICLIIFLIILTKFIIDRKDGLTFNDKIVFILLFLIPFSLYINIVLLSNVSYTIFIPFNDLVGMKHNHNLFIFSLYLAIILLKLIGIKIYFLKNTKILEGGRGDDIFQYFTKNFSYKKVILLIILFPLLALVEELVYRSFLLSVLTYYLKMDYFLSIIIISIIFGLVHYSTSQNWGHVISTFISSLIYCFALIQLGLLYPWIFHLTTNLFVLLFYFQAFKKSKNLKLSENN